MQNSLLKRIFNRTTAKRTVFFVFSDILLIVLSVYFGFLLRFDGAIPERYLPTIFWLSILTVPTIVLLFQFEKLYTIAWSFVSIRELIKLARAVIIGYLIISATLFVIKNYEPFTSFPRSIIFSSGFIVLITTGALRFSKRIYLNGFKRTLPLETTKILIFGAGATGEHFIRYIVGPYEHHYAPIGFIDDNPMKAGISIHGVKVIGETKDIPMIIKKYGAQELIITAPSASKEVIKEVTKQARSAGLKSIKILPGVNESLGSRNGLGQIRDISIEDLLGREKVKINTSEISSFLAGKNVLVTGAAGSIGSHLCRQILKFAPKKLISLDQNETALFHLSRELSEVAKSAEKFFIIGDICNEQKINSLFEQTSPDIVFHAAAYKHVPMMEIHPDEAIRNNVFGTLNLGKAALKYGTKNFVFISTDKAINPTSIMGASKRIGELICAGLNSQSNTKFCAVRFGNVLDSQGNVIGIFENQIKNGGPVQVTHPEMKRYFMITSEACLLVMQAGALGNGGEVFVLNMGEPVLIVDLAKEMIRLHGYEPETDIPIVYTGVRQGEKLFEEILTDLETPTKHEKIFISKLNAVDHYALQEQLQSMNQILTNHSHGQLILKIKEIVPNFKN